MATLGTLLYTLVYGDRVGTDEYGNRYYRTRRAKDPRTERRWVVYKGLPEPSKIPAYWHGWLHHTTDAVPPPHAPRPYPWIKEHLPNLTGTKNAYMPAGHVLKGGKRAATSADYTAWKPK